MKNTTRNSEKIKIGILWVEFSHCGCFAPFVKVKSYNNDIPTPICYRNHIGTNRTEWFVHKTLVSPIPCSRLQSSSHSTFFDRKFLQKDTKKTTRTLHRFHVRKLLRTYPKRVFDPKKAFNPDIKTAHIMQNDQAIIIMSITTTQKIQWRFSWCWTNSQCSPSKSHPKNPQWLKHLKKTFLTPRFWKSCFIQILYIKSWFVFLLHLDQPGLSPPEFLQKAGSGVVVLQNGVGQIHNVVHPNPTQNTHNHWNILKNPISSQILEELLYSNSLHKIMICFFCFTLTNRVWAHRSSYKKQVPE